MFNRNQLNTCEGTGVLWPTTTHTKGDPGRASWSDSPALRKELHAHDEHLETDSICLESSQNICGSFSREALSLRPLQYSWTWRNTNVRAPIHYFLHIHSQLPVVNTPHMNSIRPPTYNLLQPPSSKTFRVTF